MSADSNISNKICRIITAFIFFIFIAACSPIITDLPDTDVETSRTPANISETKAPDAEQTAQLVSRPLFSLPNSLINISLDNLQDISELASVFPYFPPYYQFSNDELRVAIGDMQKIEIWDVAAEKIISSIPASLPDCDFGFDRYFRLNADGAYIALVNSQTIQVWQVGGGLIYENPLFSGFASNAHTCGADLPELALSPDGKLLAVSGMDYSRTSVKRYFRVIDILSNKVLYEWDGKNGALHGNLYTFYGLGFSDDGKLLQTFDPARFIRSKEDVYMAFRFWSVGDWQEVESNLQLVSASFQPGQLLFPWSDSGVIEIRSKVTAELSAKINVEGCIWDSPCETRFSPDGKRAVVLNHAGEKFQFKNDTLHPSIFIWDLTKNQEIRNESGLFRDLEGVLAQDDGKLLGADRDKGSPGWWTFKDHFAGLQVTGDGKITFMPLAANSNGSQDCQFCATCSVDSEMGEITCSKGLIDSEGERIYLNEEGGQFVLARQSGNKENIIGEIALPKLADPSKTRVRLLGYSMMLQTLFYCVDENLRQAGCFIYDPYLKKVVAAPEDISYLRLSPDGLKAAFIDRTVNALFFYDLSTKILTRKYPYQARAFPVNPVFSTDGTTLFYVIKNLNNANGLSVEALDIQTAKSSGRVSLKKAGITSPTVFSVSTDGTFWTIAGRSGEVSMLSPENGMMLHRWQAHTDEIIGMAVASDQKWLLTMGENGIFKFWGVEH
ncbi:MAG: hypothetical protein Q8N39_08260 [Pelolinea sp.]|nr:hypothetical protein [Pelolinea sp.]